MSGLDEFSDEAGGLTAQERRVRDLLRGAADVGPMPDDVVARLDAALAAQQPHTPVASLAGRRRRGAGARLPRLVAAAAVVTVLGGGVWFATLDRPDGTSAASSAATATAEEVPATARVLLSGRDYVDAAAVEDLGEDALEETSQDAAGQGAGSAQDPAAGSAAEATPGAESLQDDKPMLLKSEQESATSDPSQLPVAERALACTKQLGVDPDSVLTVEIATWRAAPAALVVHRTGEGAEVVVVARDCRPGDAALSRVTVPAAS